MNFKGKLLLALFLWSGSILYAQKLKTFPLTDVTLLPSDFFQAREVDLKYMLALDPDRLLAPYLREAGLTPRAQSYTNWENTGLDGHIGGHYLSALALQYAGNKDKRVLNRLKYMVSELKKCQDKNGYGYIGGIPGSHALWKAVENGDIAAIHKKWVPFYNIHKTYAGIRDAYFISGITQAKPMLIQFSDWFVHLSTVLPAAKMEEMLNVEYGGINEVLADVYELTKDDKYLKAAYSFSHKAILKPLSLHQDRLNNLHANTQIPKIIGFKRIGDLAHDEHYLTASKFFWETVTANRTVAIGGNSVFEHFNPTDNFTTMISSEQGPETCNSYNMLKLTKLLFESEPNVNYLDYYEKTIYNHILSTQHPVKGGFVYFTTMRPGGYRVYSQPQTSMWCCVGSGIENQAKYNEMIYAYSDKGLFINLFIPSTVNWIDGGLQLTQLTKFPEEDKSYFTIHKSSGKTQSLHFRYPLWVAKGALKISINGQPQLIATGPSSWVTLTRKWLKGDQIELQLPMQSRTEQMPGGLNYFAVLHGPIVLAAKLDTLNMKGLYADDSRMGHVASGKKYPLQEMPMLVSDAELSTTQFSPVAGKSLTFKAPNLIQPLNYQNLELIPFYKLHDSRYIIYWQKETTSSLAKIKQQMAAEEAILASLDSATVDLVRSGEQQPESDHFMKSDNSSTGVYQDRHWRSAKGWFSYQLNNTKVKATKLRFTYHGTDRKRSFDVHLNGVWLTHINLDTPVGNRFIDVILPIPAALTKQKVLDVKFAATPGSSTANIYEVRLLN